MAKQYVINQTRQLIDLNDNLINFKISFRVAVNPTSQQNNSSVFDVAVVEQSTINSNIDSIQYNHVTTGEFSGEIENANNVYQSWYLVLKAPQEISVWVDIQKEEIAPAVPSQTPQNTTPQSLPPTGTSYNWTAIFILVLILAGGGWWYFYGKKGEDGKEDDKKSSSSSKSKSPSSKHSKHSKASKETSSDSDNHSTFAMSPTSAKILERIRK